MTANRVVRVVLPAVLLLGWFAAARAAAEQPVPLTVQQRIEITGLRKDALGPDPAAARAALDRLKAMGPPARASLMAVARELLTRDQSLVQNAARTVSSAEKAKALEEEIAELRRGAWENIKVLAKDETIQIAKENYEKLKERVGLLAQVQEIRGTVLEAMARRPELLSLYRASAPENDKLFGQDRETLLRQQAEQVLGMALEAAAAVPDFGSGKGPSDPRQWHAWFYRVCRQVQAYNGTLRPLMGAEEFENVEAVNAYREYLGILPYEADARLLQCARRHAKEMVELGYFDHVSPTPGSRTFVERARSAGYGKAFSENIAAGAASGERAFWQWFSSPPHHKNMVNPGCAHVGVGKWGDKWTQNFGNDRRLMLMAEADRAKCAPKGDILPPQGSGVAVRPPARPVRER